MDNKKFPVPDDILDAVHKLIRSYPGGYKEMAKRLDPETGTEHSLRNRVRKDRSDQQITLGMIIEMEAEADSNVITEAIAKHQNGVFVKLPDLSDFDNEEMLIKFNSLIFELGTFCRHHNEFTADGILDQNEKKSLRATAYGIQAKLSEIMAITEMLFSKKGDR